MAHAFDLSPQEQIVGPGSYTPRPRAIVTAAPAYSLASRFVGKSPEKNPAPGAYEVTKAKQLHGNVSISLASRT